MSILWKKWLILSGVCLCLTLASFPSCGAQSQGDRMVRGRVLSQATGQPVSNAEVTVWDTYYHSPPHWRVAGRAETDGEGDFSLNLGGDGPHRLYVHHDDPSTPGLDSVPAFRDLSPSAEVVFLNISLLPGASIILEGELWFVESTDPSKTFTFTVHAEGLEEGGYVRSYGSSPPNHNFLNVSPGHLVVPLVGEAWVEANASILSSGEICQRIFSVDLGVLGLERGGLERVDVARYTVPLNYGLVEGKMKDTRQLLDDIGGKGFYTVAEEEDYARVGGLLRIAEARVEWGLYGEAYADLREAYISNSVLLNRLESLYLEALESVSILAFFLALTSLTLSLFLFESAWAKYVSYPVFYAVFLLLLYLAHPGCRLTPPLDLLGYSLASLGGVALISLLLSRVLRGRTLSTLSMSKRMLRRRGGRFALTTLTIMILVVSFVSLTSFSTGYGLTTKKHPHSPSGTHKEILVKKPQSRFTQYTLNFIPLDDHSLRLVAERPEVRSMAPKAVNQPSLNPLGHLQASSNPRSTPIYAIIGVHPTAEAEATCLDQLVVEGRFLRDDEEDAILVSQGLARKLGLEVGDALELVYGGRDPRPVTVTGFLHSDGLLGLEEIDGGEYLPNRLRIVDKYSPPELKTCQPEEVVIIALKEAIELYSLPLIRVDVLINEGEEASSFARKLALEQGLKAWYWMDGSVYEASVASFLEGKGGVILIPWVIVVLNVLMTMLNSIFEYRKEISTLSAVGLNPSDITRLFMSEAAVIGFLGGGIGYLMGIGSYRAMSLLSLTLDVRPKVSAIWSFASILVSVSAVLTGVLIALKHSVAITPSSLRRWEMGNPPAMGGQWTFDIPFRVKERELESLFKYVADRFRRHLKSMSIREEEGRISLLDNVEEGEKALKFTYMLGERSNVGSLPFKLVARKEEEGVGEYDEGSAVEYSFQAVCKGAEESVKETVTFLRMSIIEWSSNQNRG